MTINLLTSTHKICVTLVRNLLQTEYIGHCSIYDLDAVGTSCLWHLRTMMGEPAMIAALRAYILASYYTLNQMQERFDSPKKIIFIFLRFLQSSEWVGTWSRGTGCYSRIFFQPSAIWENYATFRCNHWRVFAFNPSFLN